MRRLAVVFAAVALLVSACGQAGSPSSTGTGIPQPSPTATGSSAPSPAPTSTGTAGQWQLRYLLLAHYPDFAYCDPDLYPVARADQQPAADRWWNSVDHASAEVSTILAHRGYREPLSAAQRLASYQDHKKLTVISLTATSDGYRYELSTSTSRSQPDQTVTGVISNEGSISESSRQARPGGCPICLEADTRIATPTGEVPVALIRTGDEVWTTTPDGRRVAAPVRQVVRRPTPGPHLMLHIGLSDGRELVAAGAHPTAGGTFLRELSVGQTYDGATIVLAAWVSSNAPATFDILPTGPTGTYWANGLLIGSTLRSP